MCSAVVISVGSDNIIEENCSDETTPNIVMDSDVIESRTSLSLISSGNISNITGIEYFTNLTYLGLQSNQISDLAPLSNLASLNELYLQSNQISDLSPLFNLENLTDLRLDNNQISDLTPLSNLTSLTSLILDENQISDLTPLSNLTSLTFLGLGDNQISDLTPLESLANLTTLYLYDNPFFDITPILQLNLDEIPMGIGETFRGNISTTTTSSKVYEVPAMFLFWNAKLDVEPVADWVTDGQDMVREWLRMGFIGEIELQNATMNDDGRSIAITDTSRPAVMTIYMYEGDEAFPMAQLTVVYEGSEPTPTDGPVVPDTGKNTKESSTAALTATLCILSGIILTAIPMTRLYFRNRK